MDHDDQNQLPMLDALSAYASDKRVSWHMPGHHNGLAWPFWFRELLPFIDTTELPLTGDINQPSGAALHAMELAADAFGSAHTRFLTSGSTTAIQLLLAVAVGLNGKMLVARTCHQSVLHAAAFLNIELIPFRQTGFPAHEDRSQPRLSMLPQATLEDVHTAFSQHPDCKVVWLTSPDYYGSCAAIQAIADCVHQHQALLLVDEAHGSHFSFGQGVLPLPSLASGADACVQSGHKTLPVLTGGSMLHIGRTALLHDQIRACDVDRLLPVFQSSSPSFPVAASLDYARHRMVTEGSKRICQQLESMNRFCSDLDDQFLCRPVRERADSDRFSIDYDPMRLVLTTQDFEWLPSIRSLAHQLQISKIDIEYADLSRLVLIPSLWQTQEDWSHLARCLNESLRLLFANRSGDRSSGLRLMQLEDQWRQLLDSTSRPDQSAIRTTLLQKQTPSFVPIKEAAGRHAARSLAPYPPGIPIIWPGERIDTLTVDFIVSLLENNISINGMTGDHVPVVA